jgi:hypothetical protein
MERDHLALYSAMMVEKRMRKREMANEDENDLEDKSVYEKLRVQHRLVAFERHSIGVFTHRNGTHT